MSSTRFCSAIAMREPRFSNNFSADKYESSYLVPQVRSFSPITRNTALHLIPFLYFAFVMDRKPLVMVVQSLTNRHSGTFLLAGTMQSRLGAKECDKECDKQCDKDCEPRQLRACACVIAVVGIHVLEALLQLIARLCIVSSLDAFYLFT